MKRVSKGDSGAFRVLVERHQNSLVNFFYRMGAYNHAEDYAQETFVRVYRYRKKYRPQEGFRRLLYTVARHVRIDELRKFKRYEDRVLVDSEDVLKAQPQPAKKPGAGLDAETALQQLSPKLREVIVMKVLQGLQYNEIADILEIPEGTVKSRIHIAMDQLREFFRKDEAHDG